jgi:hypothetical protein
MAEKSLTAKIAAVILEKGSVMRKPVSIDAFNQMVEDLN